jgi:hypothetical protein
MVVLAFGSRRCRGSEVPVVCKEPLDREFGNPGRRVGRHEVSNTVVEKAWEKERFWFNRLLELE